LVPTKIYMGPANTQKLVLCRFVYGHVARSLFQPTVVVELISYAIDSTRYMRCLIGIFLAWWCTNAVDANCLFILLHYDFLIVPQYF
jgi:hypothetical protein